MIPQEVIDLAEVLGIEIEDATYGMKLAPEQLQAMASRIQEAMQNRGWAIVELAR